MNPEVVSEPSGTGEFELRIDGWKVGVMFELMEAMIKLEAFLFTFSFELSF